MTNDDWPPGHAEFVAYCDAHPEATRDLTPFGWFQAGLKAGAVRQAFTDARQLAAQERASGIFDPSEVDKG